MDIPTIRSRKGIHLGIAPLLTLALALAVAAPATAAGGRSCRVTDEGSGRTYQGLQNAVNAAAPGGQLIVKGLCGRVVIEQDITLTGVRTPTKGEPTLLGEGEGTVLRVVWGATATVTDLTIRDGRSPTAGGVLNSGTLTLRDVRVSDNRATEFAGGIYNAEGATLRLNGSTSIRDNGAKIAGGGLYNGQTATVTMNDASTIRGNTAERGGGVYNAAYSGTFRMNDASTIRGNTAERGGGIFDAGDLDGVICAPRRDANVFDNAPDDCVRK